MPASFDLIRAALTLNLLGGIALARGTQKIHLFAEIPAAAAHGEMHLQPELL
jgi:hypothetical protein